MFKRLLTRTPSVFGMVHVQPLPGSPLYKGANVDQIVEAAVAEAETYQKLGVHGILLENMWDIPYVRSTESDPATTSMMTRVACEVRRSLMANDYPIGIQILAGWNNEALAVAKAANLQFIRAEGFVYGHVGDEGYQDACAGGLLRYRAAIGAAGVAVVADVKKKHSAHALTQDVSVVETAQAAEMFLADGVVLTGNHTGAEANAAELNSVTKAINIPVLIGSGITVENMENYMNADAWIVGSHFKVDSSWKNKLCSKKVTTFMKKLNSLT